MKRGCVTVDIANHGHEHGLYPRHFQKCSMRLLHKDDVPCWISLYHKSQADLNVPPVVHIRRVGDLLACSGQDNGIDRIQGRQWGEPFRSAYLTPHRLPETTEDSSLRSCCAPYSLAGVMSTEYCGRQGVVQDIGHPRVLGMYNTSNHGNIAWLCCQSSLSTASVLKGCSAGPCTDRRAFRVTEGGI